MSNEIAKRDEDFVPFVLMDKLDDDMIIQELEGRMPDILTYHFSDKGKEVWGLSKAGVDEAKGELAKKGEVIRELDVNFTDKDDEVLFWVKAGRYVVSKDGKEILLDTAVGFKRQPKKYDSGTLNPFWFEQGGIKACRNASFRLIPKSVTQAVIEYAKKQGKVREVKPEKSTTEKGPVKEFNFFDSMEKAKENLGEEIYFSILKGKWGFGIANLVEDPKVQVEIYEDMKEAFKDKKKKEKETNEGDKV